MKNIAVILSGSGYMDGSEIQESVLTLLAIDKQGIKSACFAPDMDQLFTVNHITGDKSDDVRNVLIESARISRGAIAPLSDFKASEFDALIFPGGFGAALNLSDFGIKGGSCTVLEEVERVIKDMIEAKKPIGAICIAPAIMAKLLPDVTLTVGNDEATALALESMGANHKDTIPGEIVVDDKYLLVTTPCYMLNSSITDIENGTKNLVDKIAEMIKN